MDDYSGEPICYDAFRTGLTYRQVYHMIYDRRWKRRRGVLGFWHQLKVEMYAEYLRRHDEIRRASRGSARSRAAARTRRAAAKAGPRRTTPARARASR